MMYEKFKPFILAVCFPCDHHHNILVLKFIFENFQRGVLSGSSPRKSFSLKYYLFVSVSRSIFSLVCGTAFP